MNCIIIGAFDGVSFDNLFERLTKNDKVVFVEPIPYYFDKLKSNANVLDCDCYFENIAISDIRKELQIAYLDTDKANNYEEFYRGCSSVIEGEQPLNVYLKKVNQEDLIVHKTNAITFDDLCIKYNIDKVDYLQIDCEGYDQRIVNSIDLDKYDISELKFEIHYLQDNFIEEFSKKWQNYSFEIVEADVIFKKII